MVSNSEMADLRKALDRGEPPQDFTAKLNRMAGADLTANFIEQNCRLFIALLLAAQDGSFDQLSSAQRERVLRVLAYVRKDDDYIPDYRAGGFSDDQEEVRSAVSQLSPLLRKFKAWRLRHQVPGLWLTAQP